MIFKRTRDGREMPHWYCKIVWQGRQILRCTRYTNRPDAERFERALLRALATDRERAISDSTLRQEAPAVTLGHILDAFDQAPGDWTPHTKRGYIGGLRTLVETALGTDVPWRSRSVAVLTGELVYQFRQAVHRAAAGQGDARLAQLSRSANTALRSARALFSGSLAEYYRRDCSITLPDLSEFRSAPGFKDVAKGDYRQPDDALLARTMADLEATRDTHPDRYAAVWLAIGFGLRKSEAAAVKAGWFIRLNGRVHLELRAVVQPGTPGQTSGATKNGEVAPRIPVANGAWAHLEPIVAARQPEQMILAPDGTDTYRADDLFDEISNWLRGLGWDTDKAFHEFRALAGCRVAMRDGLLVARDWLRHASVTTTERHYGRYVRTTVTDAKWDTEQDTKSASPQTDSNDTTQASFGVGLGGSGSVQVIDFQQATTASAVPAGV